MLSLTGVPPLLTEFRRLRDRELVPPVLPAAWLRVLDLLLDLFDFSGLVHPTEVLLNRV